MKHPDYMQQMRDELFLLSLGNDYPKFQALLQQYSNSPGDHDAWNFRWFMHRPEKRKEDSTAYEKWKLEQGTRIRA